MRKTRQFSDPDPFTITDKQLQGKLNCGIATARRIGREAGAVVRIGSRVLYRTDKIREFLEQQSEAEAAR